jgi:hypothetical protein
LNKEHASKPHAASRVDEACCRASNAVAIDDVSINTQIMVMSYFSWLHSLPVRVITRLQQKRRQNRSKVERFSSHFRFLDQTTFHLASPNKQALHTLRGHWRRI